MILVLLTLATSYEVTVFKPEGDYIFFESFQEYDWHLRWIPSKVSKYKGFWSQQDSPYPFGYKGEKMLYTQSSNEYYAISHKFDKPIRITNKDLIIQYELRFSNAIICSSPLIKLFSANNFDPENLSSSTEYAISFGHSSCDEKTNMTFTLNLHDPFNISKMNEYKLTKIFVPPRDGLNHLLTLILHGNESYSIYADAEHFCTEPLVGPTISPLISPPRHINDPTEIKPDTWDDRKMIPDPKDKKPSDWDESQPEFIYDSAYPPAPWYSDESYYIPDPNATKPTDWDDELFGEWEPPTIKNPKCWGQIVGCEEFVPLIKKNPLYKGKYKPRMIPNPNYMGDYIPRKIQNPEWHGDIEPYALLPPITGIGFEFHPDDSSIGFSNIYIGDDIEAMRDWNNKHFFNKQYTQDLKSAMDSKKSRPADLKNEEIGLFTAIIHFIKEYVNIKFLSQFCVGAICVFIATKFYM